MTREEGDSNAAMAVQPAHAGVPQEGPPADQDAQRLLVFLPAAVSVGEFPGRIANQALSGDADRSALIIKGRHSPNRSTERIANSGLFDGGGRLVAEVAALQSL